MSTSLRRRAPLVLIALLAVAVALPLGAFAAHQFADVPDSNTFHADIDALADSGVTSGCGGVNFCPKDAVTREQMAAFLNRLGALAPGKTPVVNADRLDGIDSTGFLPAATITMHQFGGWLQGGGATITPSNSNTDINLAGPGSVNLYLGLNGPQSVGGFGYAFQSVRICFAANPGVTIANMAVAKVSGAGTAATNGGSVNLTLTDPDCITQTDLTPDAPGNFAYQFNMNVSFAGAGKLEIGSVTTIWALTGTPG